MDSSRNENRPEHLENGDRLLPKNTDGMDWTELPVVGSHVSWIKERETLFLKCRKGWSSMLAVIFATKREAVDYQVTRARMTQGPLQGLFQTWRSVASAPSEADMGSGTSHAWFTPWLCPSPGTNIQTVKWHQWCLVELWSKLNQKVPV